MAARARCEVAANLERPGIACSCRYRRCGLQRLVPTVGNATGRQRAGAEYLCRRNALSVSDEAVLVHRVLFGYSCPAAWRGR